MKPHNALLAQRGSITGIVTDTTKAVVPGATVTLADTDRNQLFKTTTNAVGSYTFAELTMGRYEVTVEQPGFRPAKSTSIPLATGQVNANFGFSKTVHDYGVPLAGDSGTPNTSYGGYASITRSWDWNRALGRGEAPFSLPFRFVAGYNYQLPWGTTLPAWAKWALWGWGVRDFEPYVPYISGNPNLDKSARTFRTFFNTAVFSAPPNNVKGNAGAGIVRGPGVNNWDLALAKNFRPREGMRVEFRADFLNAFNHTQWSGVNTTYANAPANTFGWITGARDPRFIQFLVRASF